jgi:hypothetical protein
LTAKKVGFSSLRSMPAISVSAGRSPSRPSSRKITMSASSTANIACSRIEARIPSVEAGSKPPVSMSRKDFPYHSPSA